MRIPLISRWRSPALAKRPQPARAGLSWLLFLPVVLVALLLGAVAGLDSPILLTLLAGPLLVLLLFFLVNAEGMLLALMVVTLLIQGSLLFFLNLRQATWIAVGMAVLFLLRVAMDVGLGKRAAARRLPPAGATMHWLLLFAACYLLSAVMNRPGAAQLVAATKGAWPLFGVLFAMYWIRWTPEQLERFWRVLLLVTLLQLPVVLYQHFFIASLQAGAFDSVVGTFGGTRLAGGLSSVMVVFVIVTLAYVLACWSRGLLSRRQMLVFSAIAVVIILLGEVKAAFIWLPLVMMFVLRERVLKNIYSLIGYAVLAALLLGVLYYAYNLLYWNDYMSRLDSVGDKLNAGGGYFFDVNNINYKNGEVSRGASLALWFHDYLASPLERVIGFGPGASRAGALGIGSIAKRYAPLHIDATGLAVLLWEVGILGTLAFIGMMLAGLRTGWRYLASGRGTPAQKAGVEAALAMLVIGLSLLVYNHTILDEPTMQLLFMFCQGYILQLARFSPELPAPAAATSP